MFGFPEEVRFERLVGQEIIQVCLGRFQISLLLNSGDSILIASTDAFYRDNAGALTQKGQDLPIVGCLLSSTIEAIKVESNRFARLVLDNGVNIYLQDDSSEYETITFNFSDDKIVI